MFITGSVAWLFPECAGEPGSPEAFLNSAQQKLLEGIAEAIIPSTDTPGSKTLGLPLFISKMMSDCRSPEEQKMFKSGLNKFTGFIKQQKNASWTELTVLKQQAMLNDIISKEEGDEDIRTCIKNIRGLAVTGYLSSEYYLTRIQQYQLIPGHFYGCVKREKS